MEEEAKKLHQEVNKIDAKETELKKQRDTAKEQFQILSQKAGNELSPNEIANLKSDINKLNSEVEGFILRDCEINGDAEEAIEKIRGIIGNARDLAEHCKKIK